MRPFRDGSRQRFERLPPRSLYGVSFGFAGRLTPCTNRYLHQTAVGVHGPRIEAEDELACPSESVDRRFGVLVWPRHFAVLEYVCGPTYSERKIRQIGVGFAYTHCSARLRRPLLL